MDDGAETGKRAGPWPWVWFIVPGLALLYCLSIGPAVAIRGRRPPRRFVNAFYAPLEWLYENTPLRGPLRWYVDLWR